MAANTHAEHTRTRAQEQTILTGQHFIFCKESGTRTGGARSDLEA
jgi:hypothetical protein